VVAKLDASVAIGGASEGGLQTGMDYQQRLWVKGSSEEIPIVLCLEPWRDELVMSPGSNYLIAFEGPEDGSPAVEWSEKRITVYGWSGTVASVFSGGHVVLTCSARVPEMPVRSVAAE
jgi:hypothetical protein